MFPAGTAAKITSCRNNIPFSETLLQRWITVFQTMTFYLLRINQSQVPSRKYLIGVNVIAQNRGIPSVSAFHLLISPFLSLFSDRSGHLSEQKPPQSWAKPDRYPPDCCPFFLGNSCWKRLRRPLREQELLDGRSDTVRSLVLRSLLRRRYSPKISFFYTSTENFLRSRNHNQRTILCNLFTF